MECAQAGGNCSFKCGAPACSSMATGALTPLQGLHRSHHNAAAPAPQCCSSGTPMLYGAAMAVRQNAPVWKHVLVSVDLWVYMPGGKMVIIGDPCQVARCTGAQHPAALAHVQDSVFSERKVLLKGQRLTVASPCTPQMLWRPASWSGLPRNADCVEALSSEDHRSHDCKALARQVEPHQLQLLQPGARPLVRLPHD